MLPDDLFKPRPRLKFDEKRAKRIIRIQGTLNILLAIGTIGVIFWTQYDKAQTTHHILAEAKDAPVAITMQTKAFAGDRLLKTTDTIETSVIMIYGKIENYGTLRKTLRDLSVTIDGTTVMPNLATGDFLMNETLDDGINNIIVSVSWDGMEKYRTSYAITVKQNMPIQTLPADKPWEITP